MSTWPTLTEEDVRTRLSGDELEAFRQSSRDPGDPDPLPAILRIVEDRVRASVAACKLNPLNATGIPSGLVDAALDLVTMRVMQRARGRILDPDGVRKEAAEAAEGLLRRVENCQGPGIEEAEDPIESNVRTLQMTYARYREPQMTPEHLDGV